MLTSKYYIEESQEKFLQALERAKHAWHCAICNKFNADPSMSEMIECSNCKTWQHKMCTGTLEPDRDGLRWQCKHKIGSEVCNFILHETEIYNAEDEDEFETIVEPKKASKRKNTKEEIDPYTTTNGLKLKKDDSSSENAEEISSQKPSCSQQSKKPRKNAKQQNGAKSQNKLSQQNTNNSQTKKRRTKKETNPNAPKGKRTKK